jgi:hypothetical protein
MARLAICFVAALLIQNAAIGDTSPIEREFARERASLTCVNSSTNEASCGGTDMDVYLRGELIRKLDWWVEKSNQWVREEYYFRGSRPMLVIETVEAKYDEHGEPLKELRLVSRTRFRLDEAGEDVRRKEFLEHAEFLLRDFRERRSELTVCIRPH